MLTTRTIHRRIVRTLEHATQEHWQQGKTWYLEANMFCNELQDRHTLPLHTVVGCLAALSPMVEWEHNKDMAAYLLANSACPSSYRGFNANVAKAQRLLYGEPADQVLGGRKVRAFYSNILDPLNSTAVTIDTHIGRVAFNKHTLTKKESDWIFRTGNKHLQLAFQTLAPRYNLRPCELQAVTWLAYKAIRSNIQ